MKFIGIVGSRRRDTPKDKRLVKSLFLTVYKKGDVIVSGGCPRGADRFAEEIAREMDIEIIIYRADWNNLSHPDALIKTNKYGQYDARAGFRRNTSIASHSEILIACVADDRRGGTEDTIAKFTEMNKGKLLLC